MKLYFTPGACSMAPHIVLREAGYTFDLEKVDLGTKRTASGDEYTRVNPKGYVPALELDDGQILTEAAVIIQYLADGKPRRGLMPKARTMERYRAMEWLNFVTSEVHKQFGPLFNPKITPEWRENQVSTIGQRFDFLSKQMNGKPYLTGDQFTVVDAYLFTVHSWSDYVNIDLGKWPKLKDYSARIASRPKVKQAIKAEGAAS